MTATNVIDSSYSPQASDLAPESSARIEAAVARALRRTTFYRPAVPIGYRSIPETPLRVPHLTAPKKRTRVIAFGDLVFVGFCVGLLLTGWVSLLIGFNMVEAAQRTARACITQIDEPAVSRSSDRTLCDRLSQQG